MPLVGVIFYFINTPRYTNNSIITSKLISVTILTVILPVITFVLLKILGRAKSIHLKSTNERILPLLINIIFSYLVVKHIFTKADYLALYFFFISIIASTILCLIMAIAKIKASIHMLSISGVFMFFIGLSMHYSINITLSIAIVAFVMGAVATSRLHLKAHTNQELVIGCLIGIIPQLVLYKIWL